MLEAGGAAAVHAVGGCQPAVLSQPSQHGCQQGLIPDVRFDGPDSGMGPHNHHGGEELMGQVLHENVAFARERGRSR